MLNMVNGSKEYRLEWIESLYGAAIEAIENADYMGDMEEVERISREIDILEKAMFDLMKE